MAGLANIHLPNWLTVSVGVLLFCAGFAFGLSVLGILLMVMGIVIALSRKPVPKKRCPHCDEKIRVNAKVCKHCGRSVVAPAFERKGVWDVTASKTGEVHDRKKEKNPGWG